MWGTGRRHGPEQGTKQCVSGYAGGRGEQESGPWGKGRGSLLHCREKAKLGGSDVFRVLE